MNLANTHMDAALQPYEGKISAGTEVFVRAQQTALSYAKAEWYERTGQIERARLNDERFDKRLELLITAVRAQKPDRTEQVFVGGKSPTYPTYQPFNRDEYIAREFF